MMRRWSVLAGLLTLIVLAGVQVVAGQDPPAQKPHMSEGGWTIPPEAKTVTNPLPVDDKLLAAGKATFKSKCSRCHGPGGKGDGPDADPEHADDMNLTNPERAVRNPDGVVFYKVWNGRQKPKMPTFKTEMTQDEVWAVVAYVQTLRKR